jgi:drug/metabolite transporter (DMT)-like permease
MTEVPARRTPRQSLPVAVAFMALASLSFAVMQAFVKDATRDLPFLFALWARGAAGLVPLTLWFVASGRRLRPVRPRMVMTRSLLGYTAMCLFFVAIQRLPMPTATVLNYSSPVFVVLLSARLLGERRAGRMLAFVVVALAGVALLADANASGDPLAVGIGVLSAFFAGLAYVTVRELSATEPSDVIVWHFTAWTTVLSAVALGVAAIAGWGGVDRAALDAVLSSPARVAGLAAVGIFGTGGQLAMTAAYARYRASAVAPFSCLNPVLSYGIGLAFFEDPLSVRALAGGVLVLGASVGVLVMENRAGGESRRAGRKAAGG